MDTITILALIFGIAFIITLWIAYTQYKKVTIYEKYIGVYNKVFLDLVRRLKATDEQIKIIDARGTFESDDEVGFFFQELKNIQFLLNEFIENIQTLRLFNDKDTKK